MSEDSNDQELGMRSNVHDISSNSNSRVRSCNSSNGECSSSSSIENDDNGKSSKNKEARAYGRDILIFSHADDAIYAPDTHIQT